MGANGIWRTGRHQSYTKWVILDVAPLIPAADLHLSVLESEIIMAMRLLGITRIDEISPKMAECVEEVWR